MKKFEKSNLMYLVLVTSMSILFVVSCKNSQDSNNSIDESILQGEITILVDQTVQPILEDEIAVFENQYKAKINQINKSETEIVNDLISQKASLAVLSRKLTEQEETIFRTKQILSRPTLFASDAIVLLKNKGSKDTLVDLQEVLKLLKQQESTVKELVFENQNASTLNYLNNLAKTDNSAKKGVYALNSHEDVLKYVIKNPNVIGVVGLNLIVQPTEKLAPYLSQLSVMSVKNSLSTKDNKNYYKPSQSNLGAGLYPLTRELYLLNYQGKSGLGMGFASFVAGELGQRVVLKSGLLPAYIPTRIINIRKELEIKK
jgi:phosphate transport system substrate-binding protein